MLSYHFHIEKPFVLWFKTREIRVFSGKCLDEAWGNALDSGILPRYIKRVTRNVPGGYVTEFPFNQN